MTDILSLRTAMRASKATLDDANAQLKIFRKELADAGNAPPALKAFLQKQVADQIKVVNSARAIFNANTAAYQAAVIADPMHAANPGLPLLLLPIRIETAYLPSQAGMDLVVRVYPDDIHVDTHEPELADAELAAGSAYWRAVWGAGPNQARLDAAWTAILGQLKPERAAWSIRALLPAVARPVEETPIDQTQPEPPLSNVATRPSTFSRPARTTLLPDHWRIIGLRNDDSELFYAEGSHIPDTLDLSFAPPEPGARRAGSSDADLPFHEGSRWLVDLDAAIAAGMAVRIPLTGPDFSVGQLFVLGVSAAVPPDEGAARLESALIAHQYMNGLAFLPPGTPTNNTAQTRSAWESAPPVPSPGELDKARAGYRPGSQQNAAVAARALGVDGTEVLSVAPHALTDQQSGIAAFQQHLWPALGGKALAWIYTTWDIPPGGAPAQGAWTPHINFPFAQALQTHAAGWVRSRGTLPVMRVGNQPYGLLPALSLDDWVTPAADPIAGLVSLLRTLRPYWLASVGRSSQVPARPDPNANNTDSTVVNILNRLPVSVDIRVRPEADPLQQAVAHLPVAPILGLPSNSKLFLAGPPNDINPEFTIAPPRLPVDVVHDGPGDQRALRFYQELFHDGVAVLEQRMTKDQFLLKYEGLFASRPIPGVPPPDLFISLMLDALINPLIDDNTNALHSEAEFIILVAKNADFANPDFIRVIQNALPTVKAFVARFDALCGLDPNLYDAAIRETLDVFSHRLDAWITSLAARRLDEMRAAQGSGVVLGAYGWVENIAPRGSIPDQHYIHAPSMGHAATAAVLRAGYESHAKSGPLAVNLVSRRVRNADWLAAGVRSGQTVGALLGYRFERGLHEAGLDRLIFPLRRNHPLPVLPVSKADQNEQSSLEAIAARSVVNGLDLSRNKESVIAELTNLSVADIKAVSGLLDDLADVLDSFGDLLLAESVHHLVSGNPLRAGLTADTVGRGEPVPDRFDVTLTPRSARPLTWQLGALMPADFHSAASGWRIDRPRAAAELHVEAWAATMLGNADSWLISCTLTTAEGKTPVNITLDAMQLCALDVVAECTGDPSQLELRIAEAVSGGMPAGSSVSVSRTPNPDGTLGFGELLSLTGRIRAVLGKATPLAPPHLQGADSSIVTGINVGDLDARAAALGSALSAAVQTLQGAAQALNALAGAEDAAVLAVVQSLRSALIGVADHGVPAAWPMGGSDTAAANVSTLSAQAGALLAATRPIADAVRPVPPDADADISKMTAWLGAVTDYVHGIIGVGIPLLPAYQLPANSPYAAAFAPGAAPSGSDPAAVMVWLRRISRVRANAAALHDLLLGAEALQAAPAGLTVAQLPADPGARWVALPFPGAEPPTARIGLVFSAPAPIDPAAAFCGFVCDTWTEQLPGLTAVAGDDRGYEASEVTGMAFKVDTPDAAAPQALLLAVAPDPAHGWSLDILFDTVKETLELAKMRPVVLEELYRYGRVLPAIHTSHFVDQVLSDAAESQAAGGNH